MKDGKFFEEVIRLVQETLKKDVATIIHKNHKIEDRDGELREFDVFIIGEMSGEPIRIAVECKDRSRKISREPIESYVTKCRSVPDINKKVFVSRMGFTKGAKLTAKNNDISLYTLQELDSGKILDWLGMTMILPAFVMPIFTAKSVVTVPELLGEVDFTEVVRGGGFEREFTLMEVARQIGELVILATGEFSGRFVLLEGYTYTCNMPFKEGVELVNKGIVHQLKSMVVEVGVSVVKPNAEVKYNQYRSVAEGGLTVDTASSISETGTITAVKKEGSDESIVHATFDLSAAQEIFRMKGECSTNCVYQKLLFTIMAKQKPTTTSVVDFDFDSYRKEVVSGLINGQALTGEEGLLKPLIAHFIEGALAAELDDHLATEHAAGLTNKRNGTQTKDINTSVGPVEIAYSRDRTATFEPVTVKKRQHQLALGFEDQIIELYATGNSLDDIERILQRLYGAQMSSTRISGVINQTWETVNAWHQRPLPSCFVVMFIDAIHLDIRRNGSVNRVALYVAYGITVEGKREIIALIPGQGAEGATEWARCLESLKQRGLEDVLIICSDGLAGLHDVIRQAFPLAMHQRCMVHKIRNTFRLLDDKDSKEVLRQLKGVYNAVNEAEASRRLEEFGQHWKGKYDLVVALWEKDWDELMGCMKLSPALKKMTYTTNAIENLNREIRRVTKTKGAWPSDRALLIKLFHSLDRKRTSWNKSILGWSAIHRELVETFGERFTKYFQ